MSPSEVAEQYLSERIVCRLYEQQMRRIAANLTMLTSQCVNAYLRQRLSSVTETTVVNERRVIRTLWQYAYDSGITDLPPRALLRIRRQATVIWAWRVEEVQSLVKSANEQVGVFRCGVRKSLFLRTWVLLGYATGARYGDMFLWTDHHIRQDSMAWTMRKTGLPCVRPLSPESLSSARELLEARRAAGLTPGRDGRTMILGGLCCRRYSFKLMNGLLKSAGLEGSGKFLRRSAATHVEMQATGAGQAFLGHRSPGMAVRHYLDQTQLQAEVPRPARISVTQQPVPLVAADRDT
jgi:integrase